MKFSKIYTGKGDNGTTLLYNNKEVYKDDEVIKSLALFDQFHASLGLCHNYELSNEIKQLLPEIVKHLFSIMGEIACLGNSKYLKESDVSQLDELILEFGSKLDTYLPKGQTDWIISGVNDTPAGRTLYFANTVCRLCESSLVELYNSFKVKKNPLLLAYMNKCSKLLYLSYIINNTKCGIIKKNNLSQKI